MVQFSGWADICESMSYEWVFFSLGLFDVVLTLIYSSCYNTINFRSCGSFINPSHISPLDVSVRQIPGARTRYHLYTRSRKPAMCVSSVYCKESHLLEPTEHGLRQKWMSGIFHSQEWECCVGLVCTAFEEECFSSQVSLDAVQFLTRASFTNREYCLDVIWFGLRWSSWCWHDTFPSGCYLKAMRSKTDCLVHPCLSMFEVRPPSKGAARRTPLPSTILVWISIPKVSLLYAYR